MVLKPHKSKTIGTRISIDPGISGTGVAVWSESEWKEKVCPIDVRNIYGKKTEDWLGKMRSILAQLEEIIDQHEPVRKLYIEFPEKMDSLKGNAAVVSKVRGGLKEPGDVFKLTYLVGAVAELCRSNDVGFRYYLPSEWKGQIGKSIVEQRIKMRIPNIVDLNPKSHSFDAIGIGLHAKGFMELK